MSLVRESILVVSKDPVLADVRKQVLEEAGFAVIPADIDSVAEGCKIKNVRLVMIGYSLAPAEKRRVRHEAREACSMPILELYRNADPEIVDSRHSISDPKPQDDLLVRIKTLVTQRPRRQ